MKKNTTHHKKQPEDNTLNNLDLSQLNIALPSIKPLTIDTSSLQSIKMDSIITALDESFHISNLKNVLTARNILALRVFVWKA
jgi:hypothetical protein